MVIRKEGKADLSYSVEGYFDNFEIGDQADAHIKKAIYSQPYYTFRCSYAHQECASGD